MRTTIDINDAILSELKNRAKQTDQSFRSVVDAVLQRGLSAFSSQDRNKKIKIEASPVGVNGVHKGISMNQLYDQLEAEEGARKK